MQRSTRYGSDAVWRSHDSRKPILCGERVLPLRLLMGAGRDRNAEGDSDQDAMPVELGPRHNDRGCVVVVMMPTRIHLFVMTHVTMTVMVVVVPIVINVMCFTGCMSMTESRPVPYPAEENAQSND